MLWMYIILIAVIALLLTAEYAFHLKNVKAIPIRIHINGTRGKSSITRLIAGALREHGIRTFAKTTGTLPRMIMADGKEYPVYRPARANIIEQLRIISIASKNRAQALVIECMALQPRLQSLTALKFVRATHGVITNTRPDHLDIMGPSEQDVVMAILGTTPLHGKLFTAELDYLPEFRHVCEDRKCELFVTRGSEVTAVSDEEMSRFGYVEHKENVALVLNLCENLGIPRDTALRGMWKSKPDPGAMSEYVIDFFGRKIVFINGFAANDPESSQRIWQMAIEHHSAFSRRIMVINSRSDRPDRSIQLAEALKTWPEAYRYVLMGTGVYILLRTAVSRGMEPSKFLYAEGMPVSRIFEEIIGLADKSAMVMGIGNIAGQGLELVNYFENRATLL
ncbi:MAG: poly-gamma-glutamate synthase PgsB [Desulfobacterales bacterium]